MESIVWAGFALGFAAGCIAGVVLGGFLERRRRLRRPQESLGLHRALIELGSTSKQLRKSTNDSLEVIQNGRTG